MSIHEIRKIPVGSNTQVVVSGRFNFLPDIAIEPGNLYVATYNAIKPQYIYNNRFMYTLCIHLMLPQLVLYQVFSHCLLLMVDVLTLTPTNVLRKLKREIFK